jgi:hypothetical protein
MEEATKIFDQVDEAEVRHRVYACVDSNVIEELYLFSQVLIRQAVDDIKHIESKALVTAGYAGVIIVLLVATIGISLKSVNFIAIFTTFAGGMMAFFSASSAVKALTLPDFGWFSQDKWLDPASLGDYEKLKKHRIVTMWGVLRAYRDAHKLKREQIKRSQMFLSWSLGLLFCSLMAVFIPI